MGWRTNHGVMGVITQQLLPFEHGCCHGYPGPPMHHMRLRRGLEGCGTKAVYRIDTRVGCGWMHGFSHHVVCKRSSKRGRLAPKLNPWKRSCRCSRLLQPAFHALRGEFVLSFFFHSDSEVRFAWEFAWLISLSIERRAVGAEVQSPTGPKVYPRSTMFAVLRRAASFQGGRAAIFWSQDAALLNNSVLTSDVHGSTFELGNVSCQSDKPRCPGQVVLVMTCFAGIDGRRLLGRKSATDALSP